MGSKLLTKTDQMLADQTNRSLPHNYRFNFPEPCVECEKELESFELGAKLIDGWLYCSLCSPSYTQFDHISKEDTYLVEPLESSDGFVHISCDSAYHPLGGFWIPTSSEYSEINYPPNGELIRYPANDKNPRIVGSDTVPEWID